MTERQGEKDKVSDLFDLSGRVAIVTGGAGKGYGAQITEALAQAGALVVITSRDADKSVKAARGYQERGLSVEGFKLELCHEEGICAFVKKVMATYGSIDILFNNAAFNQLEPFEKVSVDDWNKVLHVNVTGTMLVSRAVGPQMLRQQKGVVVNISSIYGVVSPNHSIYGDSGLNSPLVYGVTKAAVIQMTRYLATYWAPAIRVNCITPGGLYNHQDRNFIKNYEEHTPLGRMAGPDDLKGAAVYLASDASAWMTGHNLVVDGGWTIW